MNRSVSNSDVSDVLDFLKAVKKGDIEKVKTFLLSGEFDSTILVPREDEYDDEDEYDNDNQPLWDDEDEYGFTPLILACKHGHLEIVKLLIEAGADIEQGRDDSDEDLKPIHFAASLEISEYLLNRGADINATDRWGNTLINMVIADKTWASFLIDRGADPTIVVDTGWGGGYDAVQNAIEKKNYFILKKIFDSGVEPKTYLVELASQGFSEFVAEILAQQKLQINEALFRAAEYGQAQIVEMLIQNGADINTKKYKEEDLEALDWVSTYQPVEMTPLEIAKERGHVEVIKVLIAAGARD